MVNALNFRIVYIQLFLNAQNVNINIFMKKIKKYAKNGMKILKIVYMDMKIKVAINVGHIIILMLLINYVITKI
jgi:hypothetical protein